MRNTGTIIITFYEDISSVEIEEYLEGLDVEGTLVSTLAKKYAVEVPPGKEGLFVNKLSESDLVKYVCPYVLEGRRHK